MTDEKKFWQAIHAALLKQAHDLQEQRASVLQQAAVIEEEHGLRHNAILKLTPRLKQEIDAENSP